jgi:hypothetical protein
MKKTGFVFGFLFFAALSFAQKSTDDFSGRWKAPKGAIIIVSKTEEGFIGKTEAENVLVLKDVKFNLNKWTAVIMNPKENLTAQCELILFPTKLKIVAKKGMFHKTLFWTKQ